MHFTSSKAYSKSELIVLRNDETRKVVTMKILFYASLRRNS